MDFRAVVHGRQRFFRVQETPGGQRCTEDACFAPATDEIVDRAPGHVGDVWLIGCAEHVGAEGERLRSGAYAGAPGQQSRRE